MSKHLKSGEARPAFDPKNKFRLYSMLYCPFAQVIIQTSILLRIYGYGLIYVCTALYTIYLTAEFNTFKRGLIWAIRYVLQLIDRFSCSIEIRSKNNNLVTVVSINIYEFFYMHRAYS